MKKDVQNAMPVAIQNVKINFMHKDAPLLLSELDKLKQRVSVGDKFYHYKHPEQLYTVRAVGFIEATEEPCVVYQANYGDEFTWVRTQDEFFAKVEVDGTQVDRFTKVV